jgi:hypothetical protein
LARRRKIFKLHKGEELTGTGEFLAFFTRMLQKPRIPQIQGVKGEAVLRYAELLRIPPRRDGITRLSRRVKKGPFF